jgi:hypothetical protein
MPVLADVFTLTLTSFLRSQVRLLGRVLACYLASDALLLLLLLHSTSSVPSLFLPFIITDLSLLLSGLLNTV